MEPHVEALAVDGDTLHFRLRGVNVSLANALRRVMLAEIPCVVLRAESHDSQDVEIGRNTSRLNNELIKQRLACVPVHIRDTAFPVGDHDVELDVANTGDSVLMVTTHHFKVKNRRTETYLTAAATRAMFPADPVTGDFIDLVRLRPLQTRRGAEAITLRCRLGIGTASENAAFGVAATCAYAATQDSAAAKAAWAIRKADRQKEGASETTLETERQDWELLGAKRYTIPDSFDFVLESVGQFTNEQLVEKAAAVLVDKLKTFQALEPARVGISEAAGTMPNAYTVTLEGEGYTLGKIIEYVLFSAHCEGQPGSDGSLVYCGFRKPHPHIDSSVIRVAFKAPASREALVSLLTGAAARALVAFEQVGTAFVRADT
jgi:DNA-directed RNA polymerase alpha subunit